MILYAIGTGPGDPDLLTVKAVNILKNAKLVFAAASSTREYSSCLGIAGKWLAPAAKCIRLNFPMTSNMKETQLAWGIAARECLTELKEHEKGVFLTLGDPLLYSTFIYLSHELQKYGENLRLEIIPGITSFQAAASKSAFPLCEGSESLRVISGTSTLEAIENALKSDDCVVILKVNRKYKEIVQLLEKTERLENSVLASQICGPHEKILHNLKGAETQPHYMSLIISSKKKIY